MSINELVLRYDGICVYATTSIKASTVAKLILSVINILLLGIITLFVVEGIFAAVIAFFVLELFIIRYTLWNLYGEERLIINAKTLSYQQHYGFFTTALQTISYNRQITICPYDEVTEKGNIYMKFLFKSYNENSLPEVIYHSVLHITDADFEKFIQQINQLFIDEVVVSYDMPPIHLN